MRADMVVIQYILPDIVQGLSKRRIAALRHPFGFEAAKPALHRSIVPTIADDSYSVSIRCLSRIRQTAYCRTHFPDPNGTPPPPAFQTASPVWRAVAPHRPIPRPASRQTTNRPNGDSSNPVPLPDNAIGRSPVYRSHYPGSPSLHSTFRWRRFSKSSGVCRRYASFFSPAVC